MSFATGGPTDQVASTLRGTVGVAKVTPRGTEDGLASFEIRAQEDRDICEELSKAVTEKHWLVCRLDRKHRKLEDAFFDVLREEDPLKEMAASEAIKK